jgi:excinuclease UvrABC helicase subunit UvrB
MTTLSTERRFDIVSDFRPTGDQQQVIDKLAYGSISCGRR